MNRPSRIRQYGPATREEPTKIRKRSKVPWYVDLWRDTLWILRYSSHVAKIVDYGRVAKIIAVIASVVSAFLLITPKISITSSINIDPMETFGSNFAIKNEGHVPVYNIKF